MGKHRRLQCSSDSSSSDYGVPNNCGLGGCQAPFQEIVNIYSVSSIGCDESSCPDRSDGAFSELCESATLSTCPRVEHYVKESKSSSSSSCSSSNSSTDKHGRCGECKYKRCRCQRGECNYRAILCESSDDCSDSCDSDTDRAFIAPIAGCNNALMQGWSDCTSDSSSDECERCRKPHDKCSCYNCRDCGRKRKDCSCHGKKKHDEKRSDDKKHMDKREQRGCAACAYPLDKCKCLDKEVPVKLKGKEYNVKFQSKKGHPWAPRIVSIKNGKTTNVDQAIAIDGVLGKELHLTRGNLYKFNISQSLLGSTYSFYFTADVQGGPVGEAADSPTYDPVKLPGTPDPVSNGTVFLKADASLPKMFYYQCREQRCMGGVVFVHDK